MEKERQTFTFLGLSRKTEEEERKEADTSWLDPPHDKVKSSAFVTTNMEGRAHHSEQI